MFSFRPDNIHIALCGKIGSELLGSLPDSTHNKTGVCLEKVELER